MKNLTLVRHAEAIHGGESLADIERPLTGQGCEDARVMAHAVWGRVHKPDLIISSPAARAFATAEEYRDVFGLDEERLVADMRVYSATDDELLHLLQEIDDSLQHIMLVGHNPSMLDLADFLTGTTLSGLPAGGVALTAVNTPEWLRLGRHSVELVELLKPRQFRR